MKAIIVTLLKGREFGIYAFADDVALHQFLTSTLDAAGAFDESGTAGQFDHESETFKAGVAAVKAGNVEQGFLDIMGDCDGVQCNIARTEIKTAGGEAGEREDAIVDLARERHGSETVEIDDIGVIVSEGGDNGAFVSAWVWVDFAGTELDKEKEEA